HPGIFLDGILTKRKIQKGKFAISLAEYPQTLGAITNGKRDMNTPLALKIENALDFEEGFFMILQLYYDIKQEKERHEKSLKPDLSKFRPALFWDTNINTIDWNKQRRAIVERVFERGNDLERKTIEQFYGKKAIDNILQNKN